MSRARVTARQRVQDLALSFPQAWSDTPWEDDLVVKVGKKIFVFLGGPDSGRVTVKLADSLEQARGFAGVEPARYGLGRSGWCLVPLDGSVPDGLVLDWVEESYRLVAPKTLVARLDSGR